MNSSEVVAKLQELQDIYGDIEILVNAQGSDNGFFKIITSVEIQEGMCDEDGGFIDERVILISCE
ncbi:TPA: hypothetical protein IUT93_000496 [Enterococcus faecalis]|nr:hypothetical protein [Enterococcus faecalis]